jgi:hypothetical protein
VIAEEEVTHAPRTYLISPSLEVVEELDLEALGELSFGDVW